MNMLSDLELGGLGKHLAGTLFFGAAWKRMADQIFTVPG